LPPGSRGQGQVGARTRSSPVRDGVAMPRDAFPWSLRLASSDVPSTGGQPQDSKPGVARICAMLDVHPTIVRCCDWAVVSLRSRPAR
jgi:hypothetical protein